MAVWRLLLSGRVTAYVYLSQSDRACLKQTKKGVDLHISEEVESRRVVRSFLFSDFVEKVTKSKDV